MNTHKHSSSSSSWPSSHSTTCLTWKRTPSREFSQVDGEAHQVSKGRCWHCSQILAIKPHASENARLHLIHGQVQRFLGAGFWEARLSRSKQHVGVFSTLDCLYYLKTKAPKPTDARQHYISQHITQPNDFLWHMDTPSSTRKEADHAGLGLERYDGRPTLPSTALRDVLRTEVRIVNIDKKM